MIDLNRKYIVAGSVPDLLKKNMIYEVEISGYTSEGMGVARTEGQVVFVKNALRGEKCSVKVLKAGKNVAYAAVEKLHAASPHRAVPRCPVYGRCGGCGLMHMDYDEELEFKREKVENALCRLGGTDIGVEQVIGAGTPYGYRNKVVFNVGRGAAGPVAGFFRQRSHDVVTADGCPIQAEVSGRAARAVLDWMRDSGAEPYSGKEDTGLIRHIFVRYGFATGQAQVTVVSRSRDIPDAGGLVSRIRDACPEAVSIILNENAATGNTVLAGEFFTLWGVGRIEDELCGLRFSLSPRSFYQVNREQAQRLYSKAVEYAGLTGTETVLDLYCGTGTITLCMASEAGRAIGAEIVPAAVDDARENAVKNGLGNVEFICADAGAAAKALKEREIRPDVVVVDPPRKGLEPEVIETVCSMSPDRVVYVSCDPATLGRDIRLFSMAGYVAKKAAAVDMFPRTAHVETVVQLVLRESPVHINIDVDVEELVQDKRGQATYPQIKEYVLEHSGLKVSSLYIAEVKQKCGIIERENYNKPKSEDSRQPICPPEKEAAIKEALEYFGMN